MLTTRTAWGLDIGKSFIKAVKVRRTKVGAEIIAFDMIERTRPTAESADEDYHLRTALMTLVQRTGLHRGPVVVSIPEPAFSRFIPLPPVDRRRIPEVVRYEARQQIPFPIEEVVWDYQPVREATEAGEETEVAIFSLRSQFVYALLANLSACRIQPVAILPVPLAIYNYLTFDRDIAKGTIVIDLGAGSTDILICDPENFRVRNITVSGNGISRALSERLKIGVEEAEALKRECKDRVQAERLFKLIQPTLNDLVGQIQRTIGFFKSQIHNVRIEQMLLLGNSFRLPGMADFFVQQLGCDLLPSNTLEHVTLAGSVDGAALKDALPSLGVALGLALQGVGLGRVQVNLMPREILLRQEVAKKRPYAVAFVGCLALMLATDLFSLRREREYVEQEVRSQERVTARLDSLGKRKTSYDGEKRKVEKAFEDLKLPLGLSRGTRACSEATKAVTQILNRMSERIELTRLQLSLATAGFAKPEDLGGRITEPSARFPVIHIAISGRVSGSAYEDYRVVVEQLINPMKVPRPAPDGVTRPPFGNVKDTWTRVGSRIDFDVVCDFLITD